MPALIGYEFVDDKLAEAGYVFENKHTTASLYIDDFKTLKRMLTEKYGTPAEDETTWRNPILKKDPRAWGTAVVMGHLTLRTVWDTPSSTITLMLTGDNFVASLGTHYISKAHKLLLEQRDKKNNLSDF